MGGIGAQGTVAGKKAAKKKSAKKEKLAYIKPFRYGLVLKSKGHCMDYMHYGGETSIFNDNIPASLFPKLTSTSKKESNPPPLEAKDNGDILYESPFKEDKFGNGYPAVYARLPLKEGWLYVHDGTYIYEYKVLKDGKLHKCGWSPGLDKRPANDIKGDCFIVKQNKTIQVAYSEVQWSWKRFSEIHSSESVRAERMQSFDIRDAINTDIEKHIFAPKDLPQSVRHQTSEELSFEWEAYLERKAKKENVIAGACCLFDPIGMAKDLHDNAMYIKYDETLFHNYKKNEHAVNISSILDGVLLHDDDLGSFINKKRDNFKEVLSFLSLRKLESIQDLDTWCMHFHDEIEKYRKDYAIEVKGEDYKYNDIWTITYHSYTDELRKLPVTDNSGSLYLKKQILLDGENFKKNAFYDALAAYTNSGVNNTRKAVSLVDKINNGTNVFNSLGSSVKYNVSIAKTSFDMIFQQLTPYLQIIANENKKIWEALVKILKNNKIIELGLEQMSILNVMKGLANDFIDDLIVGGYKKLPKNLLKKKINAILFKPVGSNKKLKINSKLFKSGDFGKLSSIIGVLYIVNLKNIIPELDDTGQKFNLVAHIANITNTTTKIIGKSASRNALKYFENGTIKKASLRLSKQIATKFELLSVKISFIGAAADLAYNISKVSKKWGTNDVNATVMLTIAAVGSGISFLGALGCLLIKFGIVFGALFTFFTLGWVIAIGAAISFVFCLLADFATNTAIDDWIDLGYWGKNRYSKNLFNHIPEAANYNIPAYERDVTKWKSDKDQELKWFELISRKFDVNIRKISNKYYTGERDGLKNYFYSYGLSVEIFLSSYKWDISSVELKIEYKYKNSWNEIPLSGYNQYGKKDAFTKYCLFEDDAKTKVEKIYYEYSQAYGSTPLDSEKTEMSSIIEKSENIRATIKYYPDARQYYTRNTQGVKKKEPKLFIQQIVYEERPEEQKEHKNIPLMVSHTQNNTSNVQNNVCMRIN